MNIRKCNKRQQVPSKLQRNNFVTIPQGQTHVVRGEDTYPPATPHYTIVLPSMTLNFLLTAVFEKQLQIYPLPKNVGQA